MIESSMVDRTQIYPLIRLALSCCIWASRNVRVGPATTSSFVKI